MGKPNRLSSGWREMDTERRRQREEAKLTPADRARRDAIYREYAEKEREKNR